MKVALKIDTDDQYCEKCGKVTRHIQYTSYDDKGEFVDSAGGCVECGDPCPEWAMAEEEIEHRRNKV